jgi:hypothetical protein
MSEPTQPQYDSTSEQSETSAAAEGTVTASPTTEQSETLIVVNDTFAVISATEAPTPALAPDS